MKSFALVGNPNCGKTTLFNSLTGSTAHVGNWPGVTVDKRDGVCKLGKEEVNIVDLPGIYSMAPYTPEEVISRNFIIDTKPDCVINIVDATNLERNLYLTTQVMEMDVPLVIALNMCDLLENEGEEINEKELEKQLGVPVIKISALKENNLKKLVDIAIDVSEKPREGVTVLELSPVGHLIKDLTIAFHSLEVTNPLFHACKLAENDELEAKNHHQLLHMVEHFKEENVDPKFGGDYEALIADARYKYITEHFSPCVKKNKKDSKELTKSDKIDKVLTHKIWGIPIFIVILFLIFHLTFSNNLFFLGGLFKNIPDCFSFIPSDSVWKGFIGLFYTSSGINSPGVFLSNFVNGLTGAMNLAIKNAILSSSAAPWVSGLICDGILGGVFSVIGFLPQILVLFLLFSILEDSGYMARVAFILDRLFRKFGLSGRAFLPMIMGFGCSVPAMINTRTIADEKEREATVKVIPFFSCGAKLPILTAISGCIASSFGFGNVDLITLGMYLLGMVTAFVSVLLLRNTTMRGKSSPFVMELPTYHLPQFKSTMLLVWDKAKHFIIKAFTVILASTIVIWFISHFGTLDNGLWGYTSEMDKSILASLGKIIQPIFIPVGFGFGKYGWVFVVATISGLIAKENVVASMGTLSLSVLTSLGYSGATSDTALTIFIQGMRDSSSPLYSSVFAEHGVPILLAFIAFNMLTIPCVASVATAKGEIGKGKFRWTLLFWVITSFVVGSAIFVIGSWWWSVFVYFAIVALVIFGVILFNKHKDKTKIRGGVC